MHKEVLITSIFFVFVFLFGYWLSRSSKPYHSLIFNFHKLVGLAMGVFLIVTIYKAHKTAPFSPQEILVITSTVLIFIILVAAGGLLSIQAAGGLENVSQWIIGAIAVIHKAFPYLAVLATAGTLYLLLI